MKNFLLVASFVIFTTSTFGASLSERVAALEAQMAQAQTDITALETENTTQASEITALESDVAALESENSAQDADILDLQTRVTTLEALPALTTEEDDILSHLSIVQLDDGFGNDLKTIRVDSVNLQVTNGLGATNGYPTNPDSFVNSVVNGLGNLIIGYNEEHPILSDDRTGSHNLVAGYFNSYLGYANGVLGRANNAESALGLLHGNANTITELHSAVVAGQSNLVSGQKAACIGGRDNVASNTWAATIGGQDLTASGGKSVCVGGLNNIASGSGATVTGSDTCTASGNQASVGGGKNRSATGEDDWRAGSLFEDN